MKRPGSQEGSRDDRTLIAEAQSRSGQGFQRRKGCECQLAAIAIGYGGIADKADTRSEIAGGALQEQTRRAGVLLDSFAQGADVVGTDGRILPSQRRRMTGIIDDAAQQCPCVGNHPNHQHRVVGESFRVETTDVQTPFRIVKIAMGRERTTPGSKEKSGRLALLASFAYQASAPLREVIEIGSNQVATGKMGTRARHQPRAVRVRQGDKNLFRSESGRASGRVAEADDLVGIEQAVIERQDNTRLRIR